MTIAVCFKCGEFKHGAFNECDNCGTKPLSDTEIATSVALSDHHYNRLYLEAFSDSIKRGEQPGINPEIVSSYQDAASSETGIRILNSMRNAAEVTHSESGELLGNKLIEIFGNQDISDPYVQSLSENAPEIKRYFFSAYIFIIVASILIAKMSKRKEMAAELGECHNFMFRWWDAEHSTVNFAAYVISKSERAELLKIVKTQDGLEVDPQSLDTFQLPFEMLLRQSMLIRFQLLSDDLIRAYSDAGDGEVNFDDLFLSWAIKTQGFITTNTISHEGNHGYNKLQDTVQIMSLKEALKQYYNEVWKVFADE
jgi:hypothetical protein